MDHRIKKPSQENILSFATQLLHFRNSPDAVPLLPFLNDSSAEIELGFYHEGDGTWHYGVRFLNYYKWHVAFAQHREEVVQLDPKQFAEIWMNDPARDRRKDPYLDFLEELRAAVEIMKSKQKPIDWLPTLLYILLAVFAVVILYVATKLHPGTVPLVDQFLKPPGTE